MSHFNDLCQINKVVEEKRAEAAQILREYAADLIDFYEEWLGLPSTYWEDSNGRLHRYVDTGLPCSTTGYFSPFPLSSMPFSPDNVFRMTVRTRVPSSDSDNPVSVVIALELYTADTEGPFLKVRVGGDNPVRVLPNKPARETCGAVVIKMKKHIARRLEERIPAALR
ncbi:TPA: hypothetical protein U0V61_003850 [Escherichia coli]|nr:hypothetical protein [Escherichia coli]MED9700678.1 hypothetical protein [Escherichia coli]HAY0227923.1 hypothetical protein [Escherichia coli]HEL8019913.1 hypothetical protein [Escherichia coli]HEL8086182.1 hypothetical protein [Escherichia coli]